ncbi:helix-turn-helix domain-containing protein [Gimesia aquarii]|uniref:Phage DNA packaging protein Nu1 n=1 Tax=Gimesia aquarii TaxID=2527964 RepID=A0A517VRI2_9PLAN|nr:helix-turn-helix domain-containing protein [Gimesia aquarii]QDT95540.1 hypothetical protein V144x_09850 [Gimesia aquarii]
MGKKSAKRSTSPRKKATSKRFPSKSKKPATKKTPEPIKVLYGQKAAAEYWGRSDKTIQTWIANGLPATKSGRKYKFVIEECQPWVDIHFNETESSESKRLNEDLKKEKLLQERLKTKDLERNDQIKDGELLPLEEYELFAAECVIEARDQLLTLPKEMRRHLCKKCQRKVEELQKMIEQTLERLSAVEEGPGKA